MAEVDLAPRYDASEVEQKWYARWEQAGLFQPDLTPGKPSFCIAIPPPNITGSLHMGHALCYPIQDLVGRYRRLRGDSVLIVPGQDHAGIATQSVVEKQLRKAGTSGAQIGRDKFIERVWEWRKESGDTILNQFRRFGCAFDWSRSRFTLDDAYVEAVLKVFIEWYERGIIFRGKRVVNWDPILKTSVSDIETERRTIRGKLYYIRYPFTDGSGHITIATTRPETMLADVAVAVHPSDERYKGLAGKTLRLPLLNREIPLIVDFYPDPEFGSGAVKITPAHDANDFQVGQRHNLPMPVLLDESAKVTEEGGPYAGLDRYEARKRIVADLEEGGFLERVDDHDIPILVSERSGEPIEPLLSEQWFADQAQLAEPVIAALKARKIKITPQRYERILLEWLENVHEWCISRQLWWGHRIPLYYAEDGTIVAAQSWAEAEKKAGKTIVRQDDDVLDTWFSSGLWPFAVLGWPQERKDLDAHYPTSLLVTARDIINLWVARMAMMGLDFTQDVPFHQVYIYATVQTEDGKRMSKSLGTGVDPMTIIDTKGADALRYTLISQCGENQDIRYSERRTDDARNLCNKIWNATRFVLMNLDGDVPSEPGELNDVDRWMLSRLAATEAVVRTAYDRYDLQTATQALYRFFWSELCDWYIEVSKGRLTGEGAQTPRWVLITCIDAFLKMLHPIMPHITEELYSHLPLPGKAPFLMTASWPEIPASYAQPDAERRIERAFEITRALRALRAELGLAPLKAVDRAYVEGDLGDALPIVKAQAWIEDLANAAPPEGEACLVSVAEGVKLYIPIAGHIDTAKELAKIAAELEKLSAEIGRSEAKLANADFVSRAKPEAVEAERERLRTQEERRAALLERQRLFA